MSFGKQCTENAKVINYSSASSKFRSFHTRLSARLKICVYWASVSAVVRPMMHGWNDVKQSYAPKTISGMLLYVTCNKSKTIRHLESNVKADERSRQNGTYLVCAVGSSTLVKTAKLTHEAVCGVVDVDLPITVHDIVNWGQNIWFVLRISPLGCGTLVNLDALSRFFLFFKFNALQPASTNTHTHTPYHTKSPGRERARQRAVT